MRYLHKRIKQLFAIGVLATVAIPGSAIYWFHSSDFSETADCAVVFGAAVWRDDVPSYALYDRTISGIELYRKRHVACLVFSGGASTYGSHEVDVMKSIALKNNISAKNLVLDYEGLNTEATIANLSPNRSYVMVSNDFHLARIWLISQRYEINNFSLHAATYFQGKYAKNWWYWFREMSGWWYYTFTQHQ